MLEKLTRHVSPSVPIEFRRLPPHLLSSCSNGISTGIFTFFLQYTHGVGAIISVSVGFCTKLAQLTTGYKTNEEKERFQSIKSFGLVSSTRLPHLMW